MGFCLVGVAPKAKKGVRFYNNNWYWRPLWNYVCQTCSDFLTETDMEQGGWSNGYRLIKRKSAKISCRLFDLIESGAVHTKSVEFYKARSSIPFETCWICNGTGIREDEYWTGKCIDCYGNGYREPFEASYDFEEGEVREFAEFCRDSGGFYIC